MSVIRPALLLFVVLITCYSPFIRAAEKGGNGVFGADLIALLNFQRTGECPKVNPKQLCGKLSQKMDSLKWEIGHKTDDDLNEENFFYNCCFNIYPSSEDVPPKKE